MDTCRVSKLLSSNYSCVLTLEVFSVSYIIVLCVPPFPELANLDSSLARKFWSLGHAQGQRERKIPLES